MLLQARATIIDSNSSPYGVSMHGKIFVELKKFVDTKFGGDTWSKLLADAGIGNKMYMPITEYPDQEAAAIVGAASRATGKSATEIMESFGEFIAPALLDMYRTLIQPEWRTLDVIEHTEDHIHQVVRVKNPGAKPPKLKATRLSPDEVKLVYTSQRKMCAVARGIGKGVAAHYNESITITEPACMLRGSSQCEISFRKR